MIKIPQLNSEGFTKYSTYQEFAKTFDIDGWTKFDLGVCSDGVNHVYGLMYGDTTKPTIFIEGSLHGGHEWRCGHWLLQFAKIISNPSGLPQAELIYQMTSKLSFFIIPCANPFGYENNSYVNANGVNLNRNFDLYWDEFVGQEGTPQYKGPAPFSEPESRMVRDAVTELKPILFIAAHTWGGYNGAMIEVDVPSRKYEVHVSDVRDSIRLTIDRDDILHRAVGPRPTSAAWAGNQLDRSGRSTMGIVLEPGSEEVEKEQARIGINGLMLFSLYALKRFEDGTLRHF